MILAVFPAPTKAFGDTKWHIVSQSMERDTLNNPCPLSITAEQATLNTKTLGNIKWWGYSGPRNIHTLRLSFSTQADHYVVPDEFVSDLLDLHIDGPSHLSMDGDSTVLSMHGCDGEKGYQVHFHFIGKRLNQRILEYSEARDIFIKIHG